MADKVNEFQRCLTIVLQLESVGLPYNPTGFADIHGDPGGRTNYGIMQRTYDAFCDSQNKLRADVKEITEGEVQVIYEELYWKLAHCDSLPFPLCLVVFDAAVNQGPMTAIKLLQRTLGITDDGIFGPKTKAAIAELSQPTPRILISMATQTYLWVRLAEYASLARRSATSNPAVLSFLPSLWIPRLLKLRAATS